MSKTCVSTLLALSLWAPLAGGRAGDPGAHEPRTPWYDGLGRHSRKITTGNDGAQGYFDQGLAFLMAGNAEEAVRSFEESARFDPNTAMAFWGLAVAHGPQLGRPSPDEEQGAAAVAALNRAHELAARSSPVEQALIAALARRYEDPPPADRRALDTAYADALRGVHATYPDDADVAAWRAEARLLAAGGPAWGADGRPEPATAEALQVLEAVGPPQESHPLVNRLLVIVWQASPYPDRGDEAAARLRNLAPGLGPLLHLAAQQAARCGRWSEAIEVGLKAVAADARYAELAGGIPGRYPLALAEHRRQVAQAALMSGRGELALEQARLLVAGLPVEWRREHAGIADGLDAPPLQVLARFGRWPDILAEPAPPPELPLSTALHQAARGLAHVELGDLTAAREALERVRAAVAQLPVDAPMHGAPQRDVGLTTQQLLESRLLLAEGDSDAAVQHLEAAIRLEDSWRASSTLTTLLPGRHALGLLRLKQGDGAGAAEIFRADLERRPENGWALHGLMRALQLQGATEEAAAVEARWTQVWKAAEMPDGGWHSGSPLELAPGEAVLAERARATIRSAP